MNKTEKIILISKEKCYVLYALIFAAIINLITSLLGGASLWVLVLVPILSRSAFGIYKYEQLRDTVKGKLDGGMAQKSKDKKPTVADAEKLEQVILKNHKIDIKKYKHMIYTPLIAATFLFVCLLVFEKIYTPSKIKQVFETNTAIQRSIVELKGSVSEITSCEEHITRLEAVLATLDSQHAELIEKQKVFLSVDEKTTEIMEKIDTLGNLENSVLRLDQSFSQFIGTYKKNHETDVAMALRMQKKLVGMIIRMESLISESGVPQRNSSEIGIVTEYEK